MSEQANIAIIRGAYDAFARGDMPALLDSFSDDIDWYVPGPKGLPMQGRWIGRAEVSQFFQIVADVQEAEVFEQRAIVAQGDNVVVLGHYKWRVKATGRTAECDYAHAFTLRNGKVASFQEYTDTQVFAEAFGAVEASA